MSSSQEAELVVNMLGKATPFRQEVVPVWSKILLTDAGYFCAYVCPGQFSGYACAFFGSNNTALPRIFSESLDDLCEVAADELAKLAACAPELELNQLWRPTYKADSGEALRELAPWLKAKWIAAFGDPTIPAVADAITATAQQLSQR